MVCIFRRRADTRLNEWRIALNRSNLFLANTPHSFRLKRTGGGGAAAVVAFVENGCLQFDRFVISQFALIQQRPVPPSSVFGGIFRKNKFSPMRSVCREFLFTFRQMPICDPLNGRIQVMSSRKQCNRHSVHVLNELSNEQFFDIVLICAGK